MNKNPIIALPDPRREWLVHCIDSDNNLGVCTITVENGEIAIHTPDGSDSVHLGATGIAEFREAFLAAVNVAEADLQARRAARREAVT